MNTPRNELRQAKWSDLIAEIAERIADSQTITIDFVAQQLKAATKC